MKGVIILKKLSELFLVLMLMLCVACGKKEEISTSSKNETSSGFINATDSNTSDSSNNPSSIQSSVSSDTATSSDKQNSSTDNSTSNNESSSNENNSSDSNDLSVTPYGDIVCQAIPDSGWKVIELVSNTNNSYISLNVPQNWEIKEGKIFASSKEIGQIKTAPGEKSIKSYETNSVNVGTTVFKSSIEEYSTNGKQTFKRLFKVSDFTETVGKNLFYITIDYSALDRNATAKMLSSIKYLGIDRKIPQIENDSMVILILGNNNTENSKIAEFLSDMLITDGSKYLVETRNKSSIASFASDTELIKEIENGTFSYILQCGFYTETEKTITNAEAVKIMLEACKKSKTGYVALPSYNEHNVEINNILSAYPTLYCFNWKDEIASLIDSGLSHTKLKESDFCSSDESKTSTPLAGYVGAHMVYRNIFAKIPPQISESAPIKMSEIREKLLTYPENGIVPGQKAILKYYI